MLHANSGFTKNVASWRYIILIVGVWGGVADERLPLLLYLRCTAQFHMT